LAAADSLCDPRTLEILDWSAICERLASHTHSDRATLWARNLTPSADFEAAKIALEETAEMRALIGEGFSLARTVETRDALAAARRGAVVAPPDLRAIGTAVAAANAAVRRVRESGGERLRARCAGFVWLPQVAARIEDAIGERGEVLDRASPELGRLRRGIAAAAAEARERTAAIARSQRYRSMLQDDVVTVREGRFVVPVKAEFASAFRGIVHDSSASGQTYFVEPLETLEANNRLRALRMQEEHEVARILAELSALVGTHADELEADAEIYAALDLVHAKARLAEAGRCEAPQLVDAEVLAIEAGRHPLLDERAVPQSLRLDAETRMLLVSGPNMGGKTVTLKMIGLFVLMAYAGMQLPAGKDTTIGRFHRVFADIGDQQSIAQNTSTFSEHLRRYGEILRGAGSGCLVLVDEIGGGTEPSAGAALAVAMLERLLALGALTVATTHAGELKLFAHSAPHVRNASVRFDPKTYAPTYQLEIGAPGQSLAFPLARAMQIDPSVVARAEQILSSGERDYDRALAELAQVHAAAAAERDALARERARLAQAEAKTQEQRRQLEAERRGFARAAEQRLTDTLRAFVRDLERRSGERRRTKVTPGQSAALARAIGDLHDKLGIGAGTSPKGERLQGLRVGDRVLVGTLEQEGSIVAIDDAAGEAVVQVGPMRTTVNTAELSAPPSQPRRMREQHGAGPAAEIAARAMPEIDVRGKRLVEAEPLVEQWLDEAAALGHSPLRLIHGKGTGLLGRGLQEYLKTHPNVRSFRYGDESEGGGGVTIVELRT
jgi:DNA mismatch repair protein MutS2